MIRLAAAQILAVTIFVVMFVLIVLDKIERHYVTLGCGFLTIVGVFGIIMRDKIGRASCRERVSTTV